MALGVSNTNFLQHESALFNRMNMMLPEQARAGIWGMLMLYSTRLEVCGQDTFALLFFLPFFCPNLLMLQEHLVKKRWLKPAATEFWCCHVTIFIGSEAKKSLSHTVKSFAAKMKRCPCGNEACVPHGQLGGVLSWLPTSRLTSLPWGHCGGDATCILLSKGLMNHGGGYPRDKERRRQCSSIIYFQ